MWEVRGRAWLSGGGELYFFSISAPPRPVPTHSEGGSTAGPAWALDLCMSAALPVLLSTHLAESALGGALSYSQLRVRRKES